MPAIRRRWTTDDVRALIDESRGWPRYELIHGELLVTPAPGGAHQHIVVEFVTLLHAYLAQEPVGVVLTAPADLELVPGTITQPDVFVIPVNTPHADETIEPMDVGRLLLAIEILSPSSQRTDRTTKRDFYLDAGVEEYWIVDADARIVERWTPPQETPIIVRDRLTWAPKGASPLVIDLVALFDRVETKWNATRRWFPRGA